MWLSLRDEWIERLRIYFDILAGKRVPRYVLARTIPADPEDISWRALEEKSKEFLEELERTELLRERIRKREKFSYLDLKAKLAEEVIKECDLCERRCRINRYERIGVCRVPAKPAIASAFLHIGEETPLVPSGTIFFYGCNFRCVFCQNYDISRGRKEIPKEAFLGYKELALIADSLASRGALNINWVGGEPTPYIHAILNALRYTKLHVPQIWNSNMYLTEKAMRLIGDIIDLRLPDFKYGNNKCALRYSAALNYREVITRNLLIAKSYSAGDIASEGIIRHLVLPGHVECCTKPILERIADNLSERLVNVMDQYYPTFKVPKAYPELNRRITAREYSEAVRYAKKLGLTLVT